MPPQTYSQAVANADFVVLAVKPQRFNQVARSLKGFIKRDAVVVSIIAGINLESLSKALGMPNVIRAMPNTPARIAKGITVWTTTEEVSESQKASAIDLFKALGEEVRASLSPAQEVIRIVRDELIGILKEKETHKTGRCRKIHWRTG